MYKFIRRGTVIAASMFFVICLADSPKYQALSASNGNDSKVSVTDHEVNIEHYAIDNSLYISLKDNKLAGTTEEIFATQNDYLLSNAGNVSGDGNVENALDLSSGNPSDDIDEYDERNRLTEFTEESEDYIDEFNDTNSEGDIVNTEDVMNAEELSTIENSMNESENVGLILSEGFEGSIIAGLQERLMELGFMDYAEPTEYFGSITKMAVMLYQRQNDLEQDGIVTQDMYNMLMAADAKFYLVKKGIKGDDVLRIQTRLYETGYLSSNEYLTGYFGDITENAVKKMQEVNGLTTDGIIGQMTIELLYSEDIISNYIMSGDKSDEVLKYQNLLKDLGYLTTTPDGVFGADTVAAVKQFQSRNDLILDGYLGPSTREALENSSAVPNGLSLGDRSDNVKNIQILLSKYGYISESNATGYYGEITMAAVKNFQTVNGLKADGMIGTQSMSVLTSGNVKKAASSSSSSNTSSATNTSNKTNSSDSSSQANGSVSGLINIALSKLGSKYVYGSKGPNSFDCSGFVYWCLNQAGVKQSYISSYGWRSVSKYVKITKFSDLKPGDIIVVYGHVGIVGYDGTVIDASSSEGKILHRKLGDWWKNKFIVAWRIF